MKTADIATYRLINQRVSGSAFTKAAEVVSWLVAMQSQEYAMAKWAIRLRLPRSTEAKIEDAFNKGEILRTHLMRPTWHFVTPADIRWLLFLTKPRVHMLNAPYYRKNGLDNRILKKYADLLAKILQEKTHLTRDVISEEFSKRKIKATGEKLALILMYAELEALICSGPRQGKQFTYALLDERATAEKRIFNREEALTELVSRYFISRGPATLQDFALWSGLTVKDAKAGTDILGSQLDSRIIDNQAYFFQKGLADKRPSLKTKPSFLLPDYDEFGISYKNKSLAFNILDVPGKKKPIITFNHSFVIDGLIAGSWKQERKVKDIKIETSSFIPLTTAKSKKVEKAVKDYRSFFRT